MIRAVGMILAAAALTAGCMGGRTEHGRLLPLDHGAPLLYVALGDSTVEGIGASRPGANYVSRVHARLRAVYPRASVVNLGIGGATSQDVIDEQLEQAVLLRPQLATLSIGPNDITAHVPVTDYERHVRTILRRLTRETTAVVLVNLLPDLAVTPRFRAAGTAAAVGEATIRFNEALARVAREYSVEVIDLYQPSQVEIPRRPGLVAGDGYHPSDLGYQRWTELMWAGVERRMSPR